MKNLNLSESRHRVSDSNLKPFKSQSGFKSQSAFRPGLSLAHGFKFQSGFRPGSSPGMWVQVLICVLARFRPLILSVSLSGIQLVIGWDRRV